jgi:hypothetical protein
MQYLFLAAHKLHMGAHYLRPITYYLWPTDCLLRITYLLLPPLLYLLFTAEDTPFTHVGRCYR